MPGGRPRKELTDADFEKLVGMVEIQCTQDEICAIFGMNHETLNARLQERGEIGFSHLYKKHSHTGKASLRRQQWLLAHEGNATMLIWLGKQMLGQRDKVERTGKGGGPIQTVDAAKLSTEALREVRAALIKQGHDDDRAAKVH